MTPEAVTTTDQARIRRWIEVRDGVPAPVAATEWGDGPGTLRACLSDNRTEQLDDVDWDEFFAKFDEAGLASLHQDTVGRRREQPLP